MLDIIIPVYNEGDNIKLLLDMLSKKVKHDYYTIIIYDSDDDNTLPVINQIKDQYEHRIKLQKNLYGRGFGNAVRTGINVAESEYWVMTMADLSDSLETIDEMYEKIAEGYDIVVGSRYMSGGQKSGGPVLQSLFSRCASWGMRLLMRLPVTDISNAFRMYRSDAVKALALGETGGADILVEILMKAHLEGMKITEVPASWYDRTKGESHFKMWKLIPKYLRWCFYAMGVRLRRSLRIGRRKNRV